tara:strand:+ start:103 stop:492 length:390 start_codon:yes stop_codon:yes gene_type:complete
MNDSSIILVPISIGELFDKITILQIKKNRIKGNKLDNVKKELNHLEEVVKNNNIKIEKKFFTQLKKINTNLWEIEDKIRLKESRNEFDQEFIDLARSVYMENDKRASLKKEINLNYGSLFVEEKSYKDY